MKRTLRVVQLLVLSLLVSHSILYADALTFTFSTIPVSGIVAGPAGSTVGWGYSITNLSDTYWLVLNTLDSDPFLHGSPKLLFDFPTVAPGKTATLAFDEASGAGLYQLTWDTTAPAGFTNSGAFVLTGEWWKGDPQDGDSFVGPADQQKASYAAIVSPTQQVPEPSTLLLMGIGLAAMSLTRMARRQR